MKDAYRHIYMSNERRVPPSICQMMSGGRFNAMVSKRYFFLMRYRYHAISHPH